MGKPVVSVKNIAIGVIEMWVRVFSPSFIVVWFERQLPRLSILSCAHLKSRKTKSPSQDSEKHVIHGNISPKWSVLFSPSFGNEYILGKDSLMNKTYPSLSSFYHTFLSSPRPQSDLYKCSCISFSPSSSTFIHFSAYGNLISILTILLNCLLYF